MLTKLNYIRKIGDERELDRNDELEPNDVDTVSEGSEVYAEAKVLKTHHLAFANFTLLVNDEAALDANSAIALIK